MGLGIHPIVGAVAIASLGAVLCIILLFLVDGWCKRTALILASLFLLVPAMWLLVMLNPELVDARFRTYKELYRDIQPGMMRSEVMELVERHYPSGGDRLAPKVLEDSDSRLGFFMNPENSTEPNCEGIFLEMREDKVVAKSYSAD